MLIYVHNSYLNCMHEKIIAMAIYAHAYTIIDGGKGGAMELLIFRVYTPCI